MPITAADVEPMLTADQLTRYLAVKRALKTYWQDSAHKALLATAGQGEQDIDVQFPQGSFPVEVFDYATLVTHDTVLAALFTANHLVPSDFAGIQVAAMRALGAIYVAETWQLPLPAASTTIGRNVAVVKPYQSELAEMGLKVRFTVRLTSALLTKYLTVKRVLRRYWQSPAHAMLRDTAQDHIVIPAFWALQSRWWRIAHVYDYPWLVGHDTALAAVFRNAHFPPPLVAGVQVAAWQALITLAADEAAPEDYPLPTGIVGQNATVVRGFRQTLAAAGLVPTSKEEESGTLAVISNGKSEIIFYLNVMEP